MDKYYTPSIEEFRVGFEYEIKDWWTTKGKDPNSGEEDYSGFTERLLTKEMLFEQRTLTKQEELQKTSKGCVGNPGTDYRHEWERITTGINDGTVRVKYLNEEDILSLGFVKTKKAINIYRWKEPYGSSFDMSNPYSYYYWYIALMESDKFPNVIIDNGEETDEVNETLFVGTIKNKSELSIILKQLKIV